MDQPDYAKAAMSELIMQLVSNVIDLRAQLLAAQATISGLTAPPPPADHAEPAAPASAAP